MELLPLTQDNSSQVTRLLELSRNTICTGEKPPEEGTPASIYYLPPLERSKRGNLLLLSEITSSSGKSQGSGLSAEESFAPTVQVRAQYEVTFPFDVKVSPRLLLYTGDSQDAAKSKMKMVILSAPADVYAKKEEKCTFEWVFPNLDPANIQNVAFEIRLFTSQRFGTAKVQGPVGNEFIGIGVQKLGVCRSGQETESVLLFYKPKDNEPIGNAIEPLLRGEEASLLVAVDNVAPFQGSVTIIDTVGQALRGEGTIPCRSIPVNVGPKYECNDLFVNIVSLQHKSSMKRTRVVVHILDIPSGHYIPAFKNTLDPLEFTTVVQKGFTKMPLDEDAFIDLGTNGLVPENCVLVFEVTRPSRSKGTDHLSSYCFYDVTQSLGMINVSSEEVHLKALKPKSEKLTSQDFKKLYEDTKAGVVKATGEGTFLAITVSMVSSHYTTDKSIYALLNWEKHSSELVANGDTIKDQIEAIDQTPLLVFLNGIFLNLGQIMSRSPQLKTAALNGITKTFEIINKSRGRQPHIDFFYQAVLDTQFTVEHDWMGDLGNELLADLQNSLSDLDNKGKMACRCLSNYLDFVLASMRLNKELNRQVDEGSFQTTLRNLIQSLSAIISSNQPVLKGFVMQAFPLLVNILETTFAQKDAAQLVEVFFKNVNESDTPMLTKMRLYQGILDQKFFAVEECRRSILGYIIDDIWKFINLADKPLLFCVADDVDIKDKPTEYDNSVFVYLERVFTIMMRSSRNLGEELPIFTQFMSRLQQFKRLNYFVVTMLYFMSPESIVSMIQSQEESSRMGVYMGLLDSVHQQLLSDPLQQHPHTFFATPTVFVKLAALTKREDFAFVHQELSSLTNRIAAFYNDFVSRISKYGEMDRVFYSRVYSVSLEPLASLLPELLKSAPIESRFIPQVILPLFDLYISQDDAGARQSVAEGFFYVIEADLRLNKGFTRSENSIVNAMDTVSTHPRMKDLLKCFDTARDLFGSRKSDKLVVGLFEQLTQMNAFMSDIGQFPNEPRYEDELATAITQVLTTCKQNSNYTLFPHFTSKLYDLHLMMKNEVEAACTLVTAADIFDWHDTELVGAGHGLPEQEKCERKRQLYHKAADLYIKSMFYEKAQEVLDILVEYYKTINVDYMELHDVLQQKVQCATAIASSERSCLSQFYGVRFYGEEFSEYYANQLFIYRRGPFAMNDAIIREFSEKFPQAKVSPKAPSSDEEKHNFIHLFKAKPRDLDDKFDPYVLGSEVMTKRESCVSEFYSEAPLRKRRSEGYGEFAEWHRIIVKFKTAAPLEGIVRRQKVVEESNPIEMSPIECAVYETNAKTVELLTATTKYWRCLRFNLKYEERHVSSFTMLLNGIVNAAVNGGTGQYQELFLEGPMKDEAVCKEFNEALRWAFDDQIKAVEYALQVHDKVVAEQMYPLHIQSLENFDKMKDTMIPAIGERDENAQPHLGTIPPTDFLKSL